MAMEALKVTVEFGGGTELLFDKQKSLQLELPNAGEEWTIGRLIRQLSEHYVKERVELFADGDKIRPGILILVGDVDYELLGKEKYQIKSGDKILFISTLHGG